MPADLSTGAKIKIKALTGVCKTALAIQALMQDPNTAWQSTVIVVPFISPYAALQG